MLLNYSSSYFKSLPYRKLGYILMMFFFFFLKLALMMSSKHINEKLNAKELTGYKKKEKNLRCIPTTNCLGVDA